MIYYSASSGKFHTDVSAQAFAGFQYPWSYGADRLSWNVDSNNHYLLLSDPEESRPHVSWTF